jgi:hypothetical protein
MRKALRLLMISPFCFVEHGCVHVHQYEEVSTGSDSTCTPPPYYFVRSQVQERVFFRIRLPPTATVLNCLAAPRANYIFLYQQYDYEEACSLQLDPSGFPELLRSSSYKETVATHLPPVVEQLSASLPDALEWSYKPTGTDPSVYSNSTHTYAVVMNVHSRCEWIGH